MTDSIGDRADKLTALYINAHMKTKCGRKKKPWYIKAMRVKGRLRGVCTECQATVEEYYGYFD